MSSLVRQGIPISKHGPNARFEEKLRPLKNKNESNMLTISKVTDMFSDLIDTENVIYNNVTENNKCVTFLILFFAFTFISIFIFF